MTEPKSGGKWAAEVYDFLRIFQKINSSVFGLLLVQIGWILFLILLNKLFPSGENFPPASLNIPGYGDTKIINTYIPGAIIICLFWVIWSRFYIYLVLPIAGIIRKLVRNKYFGALIVLPIALLNWVLHIFAVPLEKKLAGKKLNKIIDKESASDILFNKNTKRLKFLFRINAEEAKSEARMIFGQKLGRLYLDSDNLSDDEFDDLIVNIKKKLLYDNAVEECGFNRDFLSKWFSRVIREWVSKAHLGLAPFSTITFEEGQNAVRAPSQLFTPSIQHLKWNLAHWELLYLFEFIYLPNHFIPDNSNSAELQRKLIGIDTIIWGSYLSDTSNLIWLNFARKPRAKSKKDYKRTASTLFPLVFEFEIPLVVIDQGNIWHIYGVLVLSLIETLKSRGKPNSGSIPLRFWDELSVSTTEI